MGYFITFEGVEGCGKTTQIRLLADRLKAGGHQVITTREPGGCPVADQIRSILLDAGNTSMVPLCELLLYSAARAQHISDVVHPALERGDIVLCDRFTDATIAYQSGGRGIDRGIITGLNDLACQEVSPDLTILLDCDTSMGLTRARQRIEQHTGPREERFELETIAFHERVRRSYHQQAANHPERICIVSAEGSIDEVAARIFQAVQSRIPEPFRAV